MTFTEEINETLRIEYPNIDASEADEASTYAYEEAGKILAESKYDEINLTDDGIFIDGEFNQDITNAYKYAFFLKINEIEINNNQTEIDNIIEKFGIEPTTFKNIEKNDKDIIKNIQNMIDEYFECYNERIIIKASKILERIIELSEKEK
jgi:hypothetical protein